MHTLPYISAYFCQVMHARCGYTGTSRRTAFVDLNDVSRKLKPLEKPPLRFVSYLRNLTKINQTLLAGIIHFFHDKYAVYHSLSQMFRYLRFLWLTFLFGKIQELLWHRCPGLKSDTLKTYLLIKEWPENLENFIMHLKKVESLLNLHKIDLCPWDIFLNIMLIINLY